MGVTVTRGKWMSRSNRVVEIDSCRTDYVTQGPGQPPLPVTIWSGVMKRADQKTDDGRYEWTAAGQFRNHQGVVHGHDLTYCLEQWPDPPAPPAPVQEQLAPLVQTIAPLDSRLTQNQLKFSAICEGAYRGLLDFAMDGTTGQAPMEALESLDLAMEDEVYERFRDRWERACGEILTELLKMADQPTTGKTST